MEIKSKLVAIYKMAKAVYDAETILGKIVFAGIAFAFGVVSAGTVLSFITGIFN